MKQGTSVIWKNKMDSCLVYFLRLFLVFVSSVRIVSALIACIRAFQESAISAIYREESPVFVVVVLSTIVLIVNSCGLYNGVSPDPTCLRWVI